MPRLGRAAIVVGYILVFWVALPLGFVETGRALDGALGFSPLEPRWPGAPALIGGLALVAGSMVDLWRYGGGLQVSALPPPRLATGGLYAWCRHPIYVAFHVFLAGLAATVGSPAALGILVPAFLPLWLLYARFEERGMHRRFGRDFLRYRREVGLLPSPPGPWRAWVACRQSAAAPLPGDPGEASVRLATPRGLGAAVAACPRPARVAWLSSTPRPRWVDRARLTAPPAWRVATWREIRERAAAGEPVVVVVDDPEGIRASLTARWPALVVTASPPPA